MFFYYSLIVTIFINYSLFSMQFSQSAPQPLTQLCTRNVAQDLVHYPEIKKFIPQELITRIKSTATRALLTQQAKSIRVNVEPTKITDQKINSVVAFNNCMIVGINKGNEAKDAAQIGIFDCQRHYKKLINCGKRKSTRVWNINDHAIAGIVNDVNYWYHNVNDHYEQISLIDIETGNATQFFTKHYLIKDLCSIDPHTFATTDGQCIKIWDIRNATKASDSFSIPLSLYSRFYDIGNGIFILSNSSSDLFFYDIRELTHPKTISSNERIDYVTKFPNNLLAYGQSGLGGAFKTNITSNDHSKFLEDTKTIYTKNSQYWVDFPLKVSLKNNFIILIRGIPSKTKTTSELELLDLTTYKSLLTIKYPEAINAVSMVDDNTLAIGAKDGLSLLKLDKALKLKQLISSSKNSDEQQKNLIDLWQK